MKLVAPFVFLAVAAGVAEATNAHAGLSRMADRHGQHARHERIEARDAATTSTKCKPRSTPTALSSAIPTSPVAAAPTSSVAAAVTSAAAQTSAAAKTTAAAAPVQKLAATGGSLEKVTGGVINVASTCGPIGATSDVTATSGPNGNIDWLNCGVTGNGWTPQQVTVTDLVVVDLADALDDPNTPFKACEPYLDLFQQAGDQYGVPAIMLASISMQESSCRPSAVGGGGEQGLMQITPDKCQAAPGGNCQDPTYNIMTGAKFFADTLASNNNNVLQTIGNYNGWPWGMTYDSATAAATSNCCTCQNNLDYIHQTVNGWLQNIDPSGNPRLGKYFNLDQCRD
ncbi:hypothetical protein OBBRIDRAFT_793932 [Obba rivulosa]|uniref:Transglycosylase SLT domain-containing protein n=1 Tax=Obba rivulosa TaxID=1052685 RepID=A0A8E2AWV8_9APHY|nr:hypothetical protein OBBRIDRAFT_793932 [Obba rivulosa]